MIQPEQHLIDRALDVAAHSPCRSQRGVILFDEAGVVAYGYNGPPTGASCPGREACKGTCGLRAVHAEMRALAIAADQRAAAMFNFDPWHALVMLHVERAADGSVVACDGPTCAQCSKAIVESGLVERVWLYEREGFFAPVGWRSYTAAEFNRLSLLASGVNP